MEMEDERVRSDEQEGRRILEEFKLDVSKFYSNEMQPYYYFFPFFSFS